MKTTTKDAIRSWLVCLLPKWLAKWLWLNEWIPLGGWAPHVLGRSIGRDGHRVTNDEGKGTG